MTDEPRFARVDGQQVLVVKRQTPLPQSLDKLLGEMAPFGYEFREDVWPAGARRACEVDRTHRMALFRRGRWFTRESFDVAVGANPDGSPIWRKVAAGVLALELEMCRDCGAVRVTDVSTEGPAGGRATTLTDLQSGQTRIAPAVLRRELTIGWYSGKRVAGRTYH